MWNECATIKREMNINFDAQNIEWVINKPLNKFYRILKLV